MVSHVSRSKIVLQVDPTRTASNASAEQLLRQVVATLVPHLQQQVGAIDYRYGEKAGISWTTEGWLDNGTYVSLSIGVGSTELNLFIDTSPVLKPDYPAALYQKVGIPIAAAATGFVAWWRFRSIGSFLGGIVAGLVLWTTGEIILAVRKERIAASIAIDEDHWRKRLMDALTSGGMNS